MVAGSEARRLAGAFARELRAGGWRHALGRVRGRLRHSRQLARYRLSPRRLVWRLEAVPLDRPIFLLGVPGNGTTLLARSLYRHSQAVYASGNPDWWAGPDEIHNCRHIHDLPEPLRLRSLHFRNLEGRVEDHPRFGLQRSGFYASDELLPLYRRTAEQADPATAAQFQRVLRQLILAYARDPRRARFVDMSHLYTVQVPYLAKLLEGCDPRFVLTVRDPHAVCSRAVAREYRPEFGNRLGEDTAARIRFAVEHWSNSYRLALEAARKHPLLVVRHEDFLAEPEAVVRRVCAFAELDFEPRQVPGPDQPRPLGSLDDLKWYPLHAAENQRYRETMDPGLIESLEARAGDLIDTLGYAPRPSPSSRSEDLPQR